MIQTETDVLIIGAGISGIGAAHHLKKKCPERSIAILEARDAIGGTWDLFRYPGIRSDSDMYTFGYNFRPWTGGKVFADGPAIRDYIQATAREDGTDELIRFGHKVIGADWDSETARWTVTAEHEGERKAFVCRFVMLCSGYYRYERGYMPDFPGMADFGGEIVHPQLWPEKLDYTGKKVVIIGSGATAVTLVPAMAPDAAHVTMLQRSPSYIAARPSRDAIADGLRRILPERIAYAIARAKNILLAIYVFQLSRRWPERVKRQVIQLVKDELGEDFDVDRHFTPAYRPWDQRFCLAPDGDFFQVLKDGSASIVTDHVERFTADGILLRSGEALQADIIIPATGLDMQLAGSVELSLDGTPVKPADLFTYRGMMLGNMPNLVLAFGYTNASWTLKIDLTCERVCRMLNHMERTATDIAVAVPPDALEAQPLLDFSSGYVQRALHLLPKQGNRAPWRTYQNYIQDMLAIRFGRLEDGHMLFAQAGRYRPRLTHTALNREAAE